MPARAPAQVLAICLLICAITLSMVIFIVRPEASHARNLVLVVNWFLWLLFVVVYPLCVLQTGKVTGTEPMSVSHRWSSPARYWVGFVATTLFWLSVLALVTGLTWVAWYAGPA